MRKLLLIATLLFGGLLPPGYAGGFESEVIDLGGILADTQEERLETIALRIEGQSNIAVQVITSFYFAIDLGVEIYYTYGGAYTHDSRLVILLKTNSGSTTYDQDFVESLSLARSANLNTDDRVPDWLLTSVEEAIEASFTRYNKHDNPQLAAYRSLHHGLDLLQATLHTPVEDGIYSGLISKTLWLNLSDAPDAYNAHYDYTPQVAGFINGLYQMLEATAELPDMLLGGTGVMARFLWDYKTDYAYQIAIHTLMDEAFRTLQDPVVQQMLADKSHELLTQVADKGYDIFLMQTKEDKYWRGVIIFELLGVFEVVGGVKSLVKGASGVRALLSKIKLRAKLPEGQVVTAGPSLDDLSRMVRGKGDEVVMSMDKLTAFAGKVTKGGKNLINLSAPVGQFRQLKGYSGSTYRAADFWKQSSDDFIHYVSEDAKYYIKHDPTTGRMLFLDAKNQKFLGYNLDQDGLIKGNYNELLSNLKTIHGLPSGQSVLKLKDGSSINLASDKANVLFGKYKPNDVPGISGEIGTDNIIKDFTILKNYSFADDAFELKPGSVHVLNIPDGNVKTWETFFEDFNKDFVDIAIQNPSEAQMTFATYPHKKLMYTWRSGVEQINDATGLFVPSGYATEVKYLKSKGVKQVKLKDGGIFDLDQIDIDAMGFDWTDWPY